MGLKKEFSKDTTELASQVEATTTSEEPTKASRWDLLKENAVLNGFFGHTRYFKDLVVPAWREDGQDIDLAEVDFHQRLKKNPHVLVFVHGLMMDERLFWDNPFAKGVAWGEYATENELATTLFIRYNSGEDVAVNAARIGRLILNLLRDYEDDLASVDILAFSLGGLVTRSALHWIEENHPEIFEKYRASRLLRNIFYVAVPQNGATLAFLADRLAKLSPVLPAQKYWSPAFKLRSHSIVQLAEGVRNIGVDFGLNAYAVNGTVIGKGGSFGRIFGHDGMVSIKSSFGRYPFRKTHVVHRANHYTLPYRLDAFEKILEWRG